MTYTDAIFTKREVVRVLTMLEREIIKSLGKKVKRGEAPTHVPRKDNNYIKKKNAKEEDKN